MKLLAIQSKVDPEFIGYGDYGFLIDNYEPGLFQNGIVSATASILWRGTLSCQPNPNMFCILKDNFIDKIKDRLIWVPVTQMATAHRSWCSKCNRIYCKNCKTLSANIDPRIDCKLYARLACNKPGESYQGRFLGNHPKFGTCILLNDGWKLPSSQPDSEHDGQYWCQSIFVHKGFSDTWEGSAGCITIPPNDAELFFAHFFEEELVRIELFDYKTFKAVDVVSGFNT